jgi:hypothetical protein
MPIHNHPFDSVHQDGNGSGIHQHLSHLNCDERKYLQVSISKDETVIATTSWEVAENRQ